MTDVLRAWLLVAHTYLSALRRACATAEGASETDAHRPRHGERCRTPSALAGASPGVAQTAAPTRTQDAKERVRRVARQRERVGVAVRAAPTTHPREVAE